MIASNGSNISGLKRSVSERTDLPIGKRAGQDRIITGIVSFIPYITCFYLGYILSLVGRKVVADALGYIVEDIGKAFEDVVYFAEGVGNRLRRQKNRIWSVLFKDTSDEIKNR